MGDTNNDNITTEAENAAQQHDVGAPAATDDTIAATEEASAQESDVSSTVDESSTADEAATASGSDDETPGDEVATPSSAAATPARPEQSATEAAGEANETVAAPKRPTAVSLGLLPETFVSEVSTILHFYAPDIVPLPALPRDRDDDDDDDSDERGGRSSRRRRRRGSSDGDESPRESRRESSRENGRRQRVAEVITEPQRIKGSTRLEAKKQRRRDGRDAGRRRPVVTEAEFLARRESVDRRMVVRSKQGRVQIGVLEDDVLVEHYVAREQDASLIGNVYLGRVQNVLPSMEAAFVDIGRGRNAVLYSGEVDWDSVETGNQPRRIELALKQGDKVLVQVTKDPVGHKGARLTSQISLPGRYLVYVPGGGMNGISRKLPDTERSRLKKILKEVLPESSGVIVRTAAEGATEEQLTRDVNQLTAQWERISAQVAKGNAPTMLHSEPDLLVKIVRDVFNEDFSSLLIHGAEAQQTIVNYLTGVAPDLLDRVQIHEGASDPFDDNRITEQIEKALDRKVWLPSGGSLVIDRTEAMTVIDVNTGKFVGSGGNLEETVTKNNLEAAEEIVRQLRLRDIGGIIVVDFIDMVLESNRDLVSRRLIECLSRDRTKHQVAEVTSLGLVQMTRKKLGLGLLETFSEACEVCAGRGVIVHHDPVNKHGGKSGGNNSGGGNGRRSRGNGNGGNGGGGAASSSTPDQNANGAAHVITEGVKSALAQIAASTIAKGDTETAQAVEEAKLSLDSLDLPEGPRGGGAEDTANGGDTGADSERPPRRERQKRPRKKRQVERPSSVPPTSEAAGLLDSVLEALPEPKAPGQGRARRRVTTAALTGTAVQVTPQRDNDTTD